MLSAHLVLLVIALVCFICAAVGRPSTSPISLGWVGLFFWLLGNMVTG